MMLDQQIERAVQSAARVPTTHDSAVRAAITGKLARRSRRRRAFTGAAVAAMLVIAIVAGASILVGGGDSDQVRVRTDQPGPIAGQPDDPKAARAAIERSLRFASQPGPAGSFRFLADAVQFVSRTEAVVTVTAIEGPPIDVPTFTGVRMELKAGNWSMHPASQCRIADPFRTVPECLDLPPEVRVLDGTSQLGAEAYGARSAHASKMDTGSESEWIRGPLLAVDGTVWAVTYRKGGASYSYPPSRLTTVDTASAAAVELQGEVRALAERDGVLWALTHERTVDADGVEYRLKRIDLATGYVISNPIPPGRTPLGTVVAGTTGTCVTAVDGFLVFDSATGMLRASTAGGSGNDGAAVPTGALHLWDCAPLQPTPLIAEALDAVLASGPVANVVIAGDDVWVLTVPGEVLRLDSQLGSVKTRLALPQTMQGATLHASGDRVWIQGTIDLASPRRAGQRSVAVETAVLTLSDTGIDRAILLPSPIDAAATFVGDDLFITSGGSLYRVALP